MSDLTEAAMGTSGTTGSAGDPAGDGTGGATGGTDGPAGGTGYGSSGQGSSGESGSGAADAPGQERTSDWFAPRKPAAPRATLPGGRTPGSPSAAGDPLGDDSTGSVRRPDSGFDTGSTSAFDTAGNPAFDTGSSPTFGDTGSSPAFDTGSTSAFDTGSTSGFETGGTSAFDTGSGPAFGTGTFGTEGAGLGLGAGAGSGALGADTSEHGQSSAGDTFGGGPVTDRSEYSGFAEHPEGSGAGGPGASEPHAPGGLDPKALGDSSSSNRSGLYDLFGEPAPGADPAGPTDERSSGTHDVLDGLSGPSAPASERSSSTFDVSGAVASGPLGAGGTGDGPRPSDLSYFDENPPAGPGSPPEGAGGRSVLPRRPTGPTGGPATGDTTLGSARGAGEAPDGPRGGDPGPGTPGGDPGPGTPGGAGGPRPRMSDDTAVLTPQKPAPERGGPDDPERGGPDDNVSGQTVTSGIHVTRPRRKSPFDRPVQDETGGLPHTPPKLPAPEVRSTPAPPAGKKGRSKLVLLVLLVVVVAGGAYGAGLLANHADVPKGTTVLGVDIGGGTRDEATKKLDAAFGGRTSMPLTLSVDGKDVKLRPDQAGLSLDTDATVQAAAGSDYNPVTVIGSLFGGERVVDPAMPVDGEKLHAALERATGDAGSAADGTIRFEPGRAVPVYGKAGKGVDIAKSSSAVQAAYRTLIETGHSNPVRMPLAEHRPTVSNAEVDRMMREFAEPAMSGIVTVKAGNASIPFGPEKSLPQILGVQAVDGKLVETYDRAAVRKLYGTTFDGVLITRGNGKKTPVTPEDVIGAMRKALLGKTPADRVGVIETNPN